MERKLTKLEHCQTEVIVTFNESEWTDATKKAFNKLKQNVTVKGFRKGKAPDNLLAEHVDRNKVLDEAINSLLPVAYEAIIKEDKVQPYARPEVSVNELTDKSLVVKFIITTAPEVELGQYKDLTIGKQEAIVSDEQVNAEINKLLDQNATLKTTEEPVKNGDTVIIDFTGYVDNEKFEGGEATNYELVIGSKSFIPGFEDQIIGHKTGDEFDVNVTFPEQYLEKLANKPAVFKIVLHEVKEKVLPELNDDFVKSLAIEKVETVDGLKESKKAELLANAKREARRVYIEKTIEEIEKNSKIDIPQAFIDSEADSRRKQVESQMAQSGFKIDQYLQVIGQTEIQFMEGLKKEAEKNIKAVTILRAIAEKENIVVGDAELEFEYARMADAYKMKVEDVKKAIGNRSEELKSQILLGQAEDFLFNHNN